MREKHKPSELWNLEKIKLFHKRKNLELKDLLTIYWPQVTLIVTIVASIIGYSIKRIFDLATKKKEIKFNFFYEKKIKAISDWFEAYARFESKIRECIAALKSNSLKSTDGEALLLLQENFIVNHYHLQIYLSKIELENHQEIFTNVLTLTFHLSLSKKSENKEFIEKKMLEIIEVNRNKIEAISFELQAHFTE